MDEEKHRLLLEEAEGDASFEECQRRFEQSPNFTTRLATLLVIAGVVIGACMGSVAGFLATKHHILSYQYGYKERHGEGTDTHLGRIPFVTRKLEADQAFLDADPGIVDSNFTGPWKSVNPSGFVVLDDSSLVGEGIDLMQYGRADEEWTASSVGFGVSAMHQMHCVIEMKRVLISWDKGEKIKSGRLGHLNHCVEILRQAVMCAGDTSLEPPRDRDVYPQDVTGWGGVHKCRDWDALITAIRSRAIVRDYGGWRKWSSELDS